MKAPIFLLLAVSLLPLSLLADTLKLKSGEEIEGKILKETPDFVVIETQFSPTIVEERRIAREEIAEVSKVGPDEQAYQALAAIALPENARDASVYRAAIARMETFLQDYAYSRYVQEVRDKIARFEAEAGEVESGKLKVSGELVTPEEYEAAAAHYDALARLARMRASAESGDPVAVLNLFDTFDRELEKTQAYPHAVELTASQIDPLLRRIANQLRTLDRRDAQQQVALDRANPNDRARIKQAIELEEKRVAQIEQAVDDADAEYPPFVPGSRDLLEDLQDGAEKLKEDLADIDLKPMLRSALLTAQARQQIETGEYPQATTLLDEAEAAWPANEAIERLRLQVQERQTSLDEGSRAEADSVRRARADEEALEKNRSGE